jgi:hypothetical protein
MKNGLFFLMALLCLLGCKKDNPTLLMVGDFQFTELTGLPNVIDESSGLETVNGRFLSFNDSGGDAALYEFDTSGVLTRSIALNNVQNEDWEDMTQDVEGNIYVGDFGNNDNNRQDLVIYKISQSNFANATNSVDVERIEFAYENQTAFPPPEAEQVFDVESMFSKGDFLYLLTKDRSKPFLGITNLYRLPNTAGTYEAVLLGQFMTDTNKDKGRITAADLSPDGQTLAMLSNEKLWLFQNIVEDDFFGGDVLDLNLPVQLDMEGIVFKDDCSLYLSNEDKASAPAILYEILLCEL